MKHLMALTALVALVLTVGFVSSTVAAPSYGKGTNGMQGTITAVGSSGFTMTTGKDNKVFKVQCDKTTQFKSGTAKADPSIIKVGVRVTVQGGQSGADTLMANVVTVTGEGHKGK